MEILTMDNTQQTFDSIPAPVKGILLKALRIAITALKMDTDDDNAQLIESMQFIESKLS